MSSLPAFPTSGERLRDLTDSGQSNLRKHPTKERVSTAFTRVYTHVLNRPGIGVRSPLD